MDFGTISPSGSGSHGSSSSSTSSSMSSSPVATVAARTTSAVADAEALRRVQEEMMAVLNGITPVSDPPFTLVELTQHIEQYQVAGYVDSGRILMSMESRMSVLVRKENPTEDEQAVVDKYREFIKGTLASAKSKQPVVKEESHAQQRARAGTVVQPEEKKTTSVVTTIRNWFKRGSAATLTGRRVSKNS